MQDAIVRVLNPLSGGGNRPGLFLRALRCRVVDHLRRQKYLIDAAGGFRMDALAAFEDGHAQRRDPLLTRMHELLARVAKTDPRRCVVRHLGRVRNMEQLAGAAGVRRTDLPRMLDGLVQKIFDGERGNLPRYRRFLRPPLG